MASCQSSVRERMQARLLTLSLVLGLICHDLDIEEGCDLIKLIPDTVPV